MHECSWPATFFFTPSHSFLIPRLIFNTSPSSHITPPSLSIPSFTLLYDTLSSTFAVTKVEFQPLSLLQLPLVHVGGTRFKSCPGGDTACEGRGRLAFFWIEVIVVLDWFKLLTLGFLHDVDFCFSLGSALGGSLFNFIFVCGGCHLWMWCLLLYKRSLWSSKLF